jgi:ectoine hydroxylase-related dioxygenase (phytanoyl-CoA dioxygenase family)
MQLTTPPQSLSAAPPLAGGLSPSQVEAYHRDGYVIPDYRLAGDDLKRLQELTLLLVDDNPQLRDKSMVCPHFPQPWVRDLRIGEPEAWLAFAKEPAILDLIESLIGPDIVLWGTNIFHKRAEAGPATPWHRDGRVPIQPLETVSVWIAVFDSFAANGCLRFIPGSHRSKTFGSHQLVYREDMIFPTTLDPNEYDENQAIDIELEAGQMVLFDIHTIHGARHNRGSEQRAGYSLRYMPATAFYDHENAVGRDNGHHTRPLILMRGSDRTGRNDFTRGHHPD